MDTSKNNTSLVRLAPDGSADVNLECLGVFGLGNLGLHHLNSLLLNLDRLNREIVVHDVLESQIAEALNLSPYVKKFDGQPMSVVIDATSTAGRLDTLKTAANVGCAAMLIEKPPAGCLIDYLELELWAGTIDSELYFNFPRRWWPIYNHLKHLLASQPIEIPRVIYSAERWNMLSNCGHFIDIYSWILDTVVVELEVNVEEVYRTKRHGFNDATGLIEVLFSNGTTLILESRDGLARFEGGSSGKDFEKPIFSIKENRELCVQGQCFDFGAPPYQSILTGEVVYEFFNSGRQLGSTWSETSVWAESFYRSLSNCEKWCSTGSVYT